MEVSRLESVDWSIWFVGLVVVLNVGECGHVRIKVVLVSLLGFQRAVRNRDASNKTNVELSK